MGKRNPLDERLATDVDGVALAANPSATPGAPPQHTPTQGGSKELPEDRLPEHVERHFKDRGSVSTGASYRSYTTKFVAYLKAKNLTFADMPPHTAQQFLNDTIANPVTRNIGFAALRAAFDKASELGIRFVPQEMKRVPTPRKAAPKPAPAATIAGVPMTTEAAVTPAPVAAPAPTHVQVQPAPQPVVQPRLAPAIPSMGKYVRISKVANAEDLRKGRAMSHGQLIDVGDYEASLLETTEGGASGFIMSHIRKQMGGGVYRIYTLTTNKQVVQNQYVELNIAPDPFAEEVPVAGMPTQHAPVHAFRPEPVQPASLGFNPSALAERLLNEAIKRSDEERAAYERKQKELEEKRASGQLDMTQFFILSQQLAKTEPKPIDTEAMLRRFREEVKEMERNLAPPPAPAPAAPLDLFPPARPDPTLEVLAGMFKSMQETNAILMQRLLTPPPPPPAAPPQRDPLELAMQLMDKLAPKPNPLADQLTAIALKNLTDPPKAKTIQEIVAEQKAIKSLMADENPGPSLGEAFFETVNNVVENLDKIVPAFAQAKQAALANIQQRPGTQPQQTVRRVTAPAKQPRPQAPQAGAAQPAAQQPGAQPQQTAQPQPNMPPLEAQQAFVKMCQTPEADDGLLVGNLYEVFKVLDAAGGMWKEMVQRVVQLYLNANNKAEVNHAITQLFRWMGTSKSKFMTDPKYIARLTDVLHINYTQVHGLLTQGQVPTKTLADAPVIVDAQVEQPAQGDTLSEPQPDTNGAQAENEDEPDDDGEEEEEDEDEDEGEEVELANGAQPAANSAALAVGT